MVPIMCNITLLANDNYPLANETHIWYGFQFVKRNLTTRFMNSSKLIQKGKIFPVQAIKAYMRRRGTAPLIRNLDSKLRWVVNFTPWPLHPGSHWTGCWVSSRASQEIPCPYQDLNPNHPACNKSLYQIYCPSFFQIAKSPQEIKKAKCSMWSASVTCLLYFLQSQFVGSGFDTCDICSHLEVLMKGSIDVN